jgi:hypothetical protein
MDARDIQQIGPYPVKRMIAEGGMSWVFEVEDPRFGVRRALKMLKRGVAAGLDYERFQAEVQVLARVEHPNVITIYDFGSDEELDCDYYTMTFVDGPTLADKKGMSPHEAGTIFLEVLTGLAQLHDTGVTHRDLKPSNVVLTPDGRAVLIDLGIVHVESGPGLTAPGIAMGTVLYMSPEQALGRKVGPSSDVFAAGLTLYHLLAGRTLYETAPDLDATNGQAVLMYLGSLYHSGQELEFDWPNNVPAAMRAVIERACRMQPEDRYPDARAMHEDLKLALQPQDAGHTQMIPAADVRRVARETDPGSGRRRTTLFVLPAFLGILVIAAGLWFGGDRLGWWGPADPVVPGETIAAETIPETATEAPGVRDAPQAEEGTVQAAAADPSFESLVERLVSTRGSWSEIDVRLWAEPDPARVGDPYHVFIETECDCWPLLFSIDDAEKNITLIFPNAFEGGRSKLAGGVTQIPSPPTLISPGGGILRASEPGTSILKLLLLPDDVQYPFALPVPGTDEAMWSVDAEKTERIDELLTLLDGIEGVRWAGRVERLRTIP